MSVYMSLAFENLNVENLKPYKTAVLALEADLDQVSSLAIWVWKKILDDWRESI